MEFRLTLLILVPLGLAAAALLWYAILPGWRRAVERCQSLDEDDARARAQREDAERELRGDAQE